jgi:transposase
LSRPRPDEQPFRDLKLLVDHRDDLVDERRRVQQRLRWHLHQLDPSFVVPARRLDRPMQLDRVGRWLARREQEVQVRVARELVARCRSLTRTIVELERELEQRTAQTAPALLELPGCAALTAAKLLAEVGPIGLEATARSPSRGQLGSWIESEHDLVRLLVAPMSEPAPLAHDTKTALRQHTNRRGVIARSASVKRTGCLQLQELL